MYELCFHSQHNSWKNPTLQWEISDFPEPMEKSYSVVMMELKEIVEKRLQQLGVGAVEAATAGGLERTFIRDIVEGKKKSVRADKMLGLARALKLDHFALAEGRIQEENAEQSLTPIRGEAEILQTLKRIEGLNDHDIQLHFELIMRDIRFNASAREQSRSDDQPQQSTPHHALKP